MGKTERVGSNQWSSCESSENPVNPVHSPCKIRPRAGAASPDAALDPRLSSIRGRYRPCAAITSTEPGEPAAFANRSRDFDFATR